MSQHTPTPWRADHRDICQVRDDGRNLLVIGTMTGGFHDDAIAEQDAAFIVRAVNAYGQMKSALEEVEELRFWLRRAAGVLAPHSADPAGSPTRDALVFVNAGLSPQAREQVRAALAHEGPGQ